MGAQRSQPRSRKRRRHAPPPAGGAVRPARRTEPSPPDTGEQVRSGPRRTSPLGAYGERPPGPFGGLPVSEFAIFAGAVVLIVGVIQHGAPALIGGVVLCLLGVTEVTAREHLSGYRSHTVLLAAIPAVVAEFVIVLTVGTPAVRVLLLVPVAAVFGACAWFLRRRFLVARQARLAKPLPRR
ncbi:MAG TPA: hypothetical protein VFH80_35120 [Solirubrobacteraceae bacterium]|nr:hypothetical protein [Solirubrobacteraceae bacterium]